MAQRSRVLIVDDERSVRTALELAMPPGLEAQAVESAEAALALLRLSRFDLLVVDKNLPGMSGLDLLRRVKEEYPRPPWAMLITGYASAQTALESVELQVYGYLEKPFRDIFEVTFELERLATLKSAHDARTEAPQRPLR
ncbi:MAG: response regulator [Myxococcaceae bacterium]